MRQLERVLVKCLLTLALLLYADGSHAIPLSTRSEKIGVMIPLSGDFARFGERVRRGVLASGVDAQRLRFEDEACQSRQALTSFNFLAAEGFRFFIGPMCGAPQVVVAPLLKRIDGVAVVGSAAPERVFTESQGRMFSSQPSIEQESRFNAHELERLGVRRVVVVMYESDYSRTHLAAFKGSYTGTIVDVLSHSAADQNEIRSFAVKVKALAPEALYVPDGYPLILGLMKELQRIGLSSLRVFSVFPAQSVDVLEASGPAAESLIYSYPDIGDKDALEYYPEKAAAMLTRAMEGCTADTRCVMVQLRAQNQFNEFGNPVGRFVLKTVRNGRFVPYVPSPQ